MKYVAVTADLVKSTRLPNRAAVQEKVKEALRNINSKFNKEIVVKFSFSGGDEFQGLMRSAKAAFNIVKEFQKQLYPIKAYFGVGLGTLSTGLAKTTVEMDGECFRLSRQAIEQAKKDKQEIVFRTGDQEKDDALNTVMSLISAIKSSWKDIHYRRIWDYEQLGSLEKVAEKEKVSIRAISKTLQIANYEALKRAKEFVDKQLQVEIQNSTPRVEN